jgi:hypothetical protein
LHDLRGSAATAFYRAGLDIRVISEIMGWQEEAVQKILRKYVDRSTATRAVIEKMRAARQAQEAIRQGGNVIALNAKLPAGDNPAVSGKNENGQ